MLKLFMKNKKGFTLVELMVVVVILGILVAIAIPIYNNVTDDAKQKACDSNVKAIQAAVSMYQTANSGALPKQLEDLVPKYIEAIPKCPVNDAENTYSIDKNGIVKCSH